MCPAGWNCREYWTNDKDLKGGNGRNGTGNGRNGSGGDNLARGKMVTHQMGKMAT
jgi:hypothetical protein